MKSKLEKLAYKLCSTEVKMLIDKIEEHPRSVPMRSDPYPSHSYAAIVTDGAYSFRDRVALALAVRRIRLQTTKARIVEMIFEGQKEHEQVRNVAGPYVPGEPLSARKIAEQAQRVLEREMSKQYQLHLEAHVDVARKEGLL